MKVITLIALTSINLFAQDIPKEPFLPTGSILKATLTNAVFSYNLEVPVVAELDREAQFCNPTNPEACGPIVFPRKTRLIGRALILKSNDRININFYLAVLPSGQELSLEALALSPDGSAGVRGKVSKHKDSLVASAALKGAILGAASMAPSASNPVAEGAADEIVQAAASEVDLAREKVDTSIEVPAYTRCMIYLVRRLEISKESGSQNLMEKP